MTINTMSFTLDGLVSLSESLGEAIGRGVMRGMNVGLPGNLAPSAPGAPRVLGTSASVRRPGRPSKAPASAGPVPADRHCQVEGCGSPTRSKGLCSKHYQAERRRIQAKG